MDAFIKNLEEMKEAIRLFDEAICIKASKSNLLEFREYVELNFVQL
jgi:hypothetical protein